MEAFLGGLTKQAMNYAIKSGVAITANYVYQQSSRLIKKVDGRDKADLEQLQQQLDIQIRIISPAIDMIELISARGNTSLESAKGLTKSLRLQIQALGQRIAQAATQEERLVNSKNVKELEAAEAEIKSIIVDIKTLLTRLDFAVPLFNLAITASGANLSGRLPETVSTSRLLLASKFIEAGDYQYGKTRWEAVQIGPTFTLSLYMLFTGHARPLIEEDIRNTTWKEVIHKTRLKLTRVPLEQLYSLPGEHSQPADTTHSFAAESRRDEYAYQILIVEDLDDDRVHTYEEHEEQPTSFQDVGLAGIKEVIPVHEISKIFYADTGKILNIGQDGEGNSPILLLRRDIHAQAPRRMMPEFDEPIESIEEADSEANNTPIPSSGTAWKIPRDLDPEWLAFEVYTEAEDSDEESNPTPDGLPRSIVHPTNLANALSNLDINDSTPSRLAPAIPTSLSLLEVILRLLSLQQFQQMSHISASDEMLNFFLAEAATTGAANGDDVERRRIRNEARGKLGFDPYDESPIKRRGEEYQRGGMNQDTSRSTADVSFGTPELLQMPTTPQHLLDAKPHFSPRSTPDLPPLPRSASSSKSPQTTPTGASRFRAIQEKARRGSPLARKSDGPNSDTVPDTF